MKLTIPEHLGDINLFQYQRYQKKPDDKIYKIHVFTDAPLKDCKLMKANDIERLSNVIDNALQFSTDFTHRFTMKDIEFGFIPNLDKITFAEYVDLQTYANDIDNLHRLMAILFRPIYKRDGDKYSIMPYNGTEGYADIMLHTPMNLVNGALVFFWNLTNELSNSTQKYLTEALVRDMKQRNTSKLLDGMLLLRSWLGITSLKLTKY